METAPTSTVLQGAGRCVSAGHDRPRSKLVRDSARLEPDHPEQPRFGVKVDETGLQIPFHIVKWDHVSQIPGGPLHRPPELLPVRPPRDRQDDMAQAAVPGRDLPRPARPCPVSGAARPTTAPAGPDPARIRRVGRARRSAADAAGPQRGPSPDRGRRAPLHPDRIERAQPAPARRQPAGRPCAHLPPVPADGGRGRRRLRAGARADPRSAPLGVHPARSGRVPGIVRRELPAPGGAGRRTHPQPGHVQPVPGKRQLLAGGAPQRGRGGTRCRRGPQDRRPPTSTCWRTC